MWLEPDLRLPPACPPYECTTRSYYSEIDYIVWPYNSHPCHKLVASCLPKLSMTPIWMKKRERKIKKSKIHMCKHCESKMVLEFEKHFA